jgi:hypothetical protein
MQAAQRLAASSIGQTQARSFAHIELEGDAVEHGIACRLRVRASKCEQGCERGAHGFYFTTLM